MTPSTDSLQRLHATLTGRLLAEIGPDGVWAGRLSASALATAVSVYALFRFDADAHRRLIDHGIAWLGRHQNADGGWGDTPQSRSNLSTTLLCVSTLRAVAPADPALAGADDWLAQHLPAVTPAAIIEAVNQTYKNDRTFSCPILSVCALTGLLGDPRQAFGHIQPLPFELACLPSGFFRFVRMPVVSYALPALIALGQLHYHFRKPANPAVRLIRRLSLGITRSRLAAIQPSNGGFLEAAPLTAFVAISLCAAGRRHHPVCRRGVDFLVQSVRPDGSWPIDTNLSTWVTSLSITALLRHADGAPALSAPQQRHLIRTLMDWQFKTPHPYTGARPGGWAWTPLPGGVPDADDTAAALAALTALLDAQPDAPDADARTTLAAGVRWLIDLQNTDGGVPTFCRGRMRFDFDTSAPDITAHAVAALARCRRRPPFQQRPDIDAFIARALACLRDRQSPAGLWTPLWFGNEYLPDQANPVFGTARIVTGLCEAAATLDLPEGMIARAVAGLLAAQSSEGGWGRKDAHAASIEETAVVLEALAAARLNGPRATGPATPLTTDAVRAAIDHGTDWLSRQVNRPPEAMEPAPIGLYFARLWYHEALYPLIFSVAALAAVLAERKQRP